MFNKNRVEYMIVGGYALAFHGAPRYTKLWGQLGVPPVRIDIITSITGVTWDEASRGKLSVSYGGTEVNIIGREEFIVNKKAIGRKRDIADLESLGIE